MAQVIVAEYSFKTYFKIPLGMDLKDTNIIKSCYIKWDTLHIHFVDESKASLEIESCYQDEQDMKYPDNHPDGKYDIEIENLEDYDFLIDELEDSEYDESPDEEEDSDGTSRE